MTTEIYIFKTSVRSKQQADFLKPHIERVRSIVQWNFDLNNPDDKIFRAEASENISRTIISLFRHHGFDCLRLKAVRLHKRHNGINSNETVSFRAFRSPALLLLAGGLTFWIGAFTPPYKQWMTNNLAEYLAIIGQSGINWYFMHGAFLVGIFLTVLGLHRISSNDKSERNIWFGIASSVFTMAGLLAMINFAFRLTATVYAANKFVEGGDIESYFPPLMQWSNLIFALYMIMAYISCACFGYGLQQFPQIGKWISVFCMAFGVAGAVSYPLGLIVFEPPLMIHLPFIVASVMILKYKPNVFDLDT